jgi:hypothetical protein
VVTSANVSEPPLQTLAASSLFSVTSPTGFPITEYQFWDSTRDPASGHFYVNGVQQAPGTVIDVPASQLGQVSFVTGTVGNLLQVRTFDGVSWSASDTAPWAPFNISASVAPPAGLVHWWSGDRNTIDSVGGDTATLEGATYSTGKLGQAFSFDGTDDSVSLGASNLIGAGQDPFTIAMWVYPTETPSGWFYILAGLQQDSQVILDVSDDFHGSSGNYIGMEFRGDTQWWVPLPHALLNNWTQIVAVYNGGDKNNASSFEYYLDGVQLSGTPFNGGPTGGSANDNELGEAGGGFYTGLLEDVQIYDRALSGTEIQALASATRSESVSSARQTITVTDPSATSLLVQGMASFGASEAGSSDIGIVSPPSQTGTVTNLAPPGH